MKKTSLSTWFETFFDEKKLEDEIYTIEHEGQIHIMETSVVIEYIIHHTDSDSQRKIQQVLVKMDFHHRSHKTFHDYLKFLAKAYIQEFA
jgi:hypothetical protein